MSVARAAAPSQWWHLGSGAYALLCAPAILVAEQQGWPERPLHSTQLLATLVCLMTSVRYLRSTRGCSLGIRRPLALAVSVASGLWVGFVCFVVLVFMFSGAMD